MIGLLYPQPSSSGSSSEKNACIKEQRYVVPQRYDGVRQLASLAAPQDPDNGGFLATSTELPRRRPGASELEGYRSNTDETGGQLAVTAIQSAGDVHEIKELNNSGEVGTLCVAVVRQSLKQASREIWGTTKGGGAVANQTKSVRFGGGPDGVSSTGALQVLLRRYARAFASRGSEGVQQYPEACLVLYCKLAGGVFMASPLDGSAFRLRQQQLPIAEDEEARAREPTETTQLTCWTLPPEGFEALLDLENSVVPGLPALARDMANDKRLATKIGCGLTPLAEQISVQLFDSDENRAQHVVVPRVAGIVFASLGTAAASTASHRRDTSVGSSDASLRVLAVLARLEQADGNVVHRFVLEDFDVFGDDGAEESSPGTGRRTNRRSAKGRTRRVSLPTTYAALLEEATSPRPSPGPNIATRILRRWRRGNKYRAGVNQVVPGVGEVTVLEKEQQEPFLGAGQSARLEKATTAPREINENSTSAATAIRGGKVKRSSQSKKLGENLLSVGDVMSASLTQAALWASTRDVIRAMMAAACRPGGNSCSTPETQRSTAESTGGSCAAARRAACALLAKAFGNVSAGEEETGQNTTGMGGQEASAALDWWYEGYCAATAPPCGGGRLDLGGSSLLLQEEAPRLLLNEMLEVPALKAAFVGRGLTRHLADALRAGSPEMKTRELSIWHQNRIRHAPDGEAPSCGVKKLPKNDGSEISCACAAKNRGRIRPRNHTADGKANLPWWLLFSQGRGGGGAGGHRYGFSETLKNLGEGADGVCAEADGRSCQTALDEIFAPERGKEERGAQTSREDDPTADGNSLGSAGGLPVPLTATQRECREREQVINWYTASGGAISTKTGRVAPPMLRLDALGSILDTEECVSARFCSSHAVASLSAASTRAASEHLPTFLSARGATSRAFARHGSARSVRTGRTTQRDSTASTGCPTVRSTSPSAPADMEVAAAPPPLLSPQPSSRYSDGEPVCCCEDRDGGAGSCGGAVETEPWPAPDEKASTGKARGGNSESVAVDDTGGQHPGGDRKAGAASAVPARRGEGGSSGREGMPRLHLEGLPANKAGPASKVVGATGGSIAGAPSSPTTNIGQGFLNESAARPGRVEVASRGSLQSTNESPDGYVRRPGERATPEGGVNGALGCRFHGFLTGIAPAAVEYNGFRCVPRDTTPVALVLNLARASAPGLASRSSPSQPQQTPTSMSHVFGAEIAAATLLVSLLPSTTVEHHPEESLQVALDVLSFVGTLSWIYGAEALPAATTATTTYDSKPATGPTICHPRDAPEALWETRPMEVWPTELDNVDLRLLANTAGRQLNLRLMELQSLFEQGRQDDRDEEMASYKHQSRVHDACRLVLECTWLTRLILRSVMAAGALDEKLRSALCAKAAGDAMLFCGRALGTLQRCMRNTISRSPSSASSPRRPAICNDGAPEQPPEVFLEHEGCAAETLILTAPVAADLAALLVALVRQPMAWGEDPAWAARTLGSAAPCCDGGDEAIIPALVELIGHLVTEAPRKEGDPQQSVGSEGDQLQGVRHGHSSLPGAAEILEKGLTGGRSVLDHLLVAVLDSIAAVFLRAKILIDTSEDTPQGVLGSAVAAETARVDRAQEETIKAVSRVARRSECLFQPGGPVLTILEMQFPPTPLHSESTFLQSRPVGSAVPIPCVTAVLQLSTLFFSLCRKAGIRDEAEFARLEDFVGPLFSGFRRRRGGFVGGRSPDVDHAVPSTEQRRRVGNEARHEPPVEEDKLIRPERESGVSLCRLNLEALVELAATRDPAVLQRLDERRVAPFLLRHVLAIGDGAARRREELLESLGAPQGSEERQLSLRNRSDITTQAPQRTGQPGSASHGGSGGCGDDTPERTKPPETTATGRVLHAGAPSLSVEDRVEGLVSVKSGRPRWFPGRVERVNGVDGTVHVCYDDGDEEPNKDPREVRPSCRKPTERTRRPLRSGVAQQHPGCKKTPATAAPVTASAATAVRQGGKQRPGTDAMSLRPGLSPAADGVVSSVDGPRPRPAENAGEAPPSCRDQNIGKSEATEMISPGAAMEGGGQPATAKLSPAIAVSGRKNGDPEAAVSTADGSGNYGENDSEDDDAYFVIPSVLDATAAASKSNIRPFPAVDSSSPISVVPRIDLQSPVFRTRVFSSQLGPGSSLSTPTTGGGRVLDTFRGGGGSRPEASSPTPAFPNRRSSQAQRPPSLIARSLRSSGVTRRASVLSNSDPSPANPRGPEREVARLLSGEIETSSSEEEEDDNEEEEDELGSSTSEPVGRCPTRRASRGTGEDEMGKGHAAPATTTPGVQAGVAEPLPDEKHCHLGDDSGATTKARRQSDDDKRVMKALAVTLLLSMAATPSNIASLGWGYSSPPVPIEGSGKQENAEVGQIMTLLQEFFDDDQNAGVVPSLRTRWRSTVKSTAESAPAVLAKLVCAALFDSQSYSLDGDHVSAGRFGGIIVSKCPLHLGGPRRCQASAQACAVTSAMGRREEPESSATLPSLSSSSSSSGPRRDVEIADETDEVALKVVERDELDSAIGANVFVEVFALRTLADVPGVCHLYDFGVTPASYILVIERCVGSLKEWRLARGAGGDSGGEDCDSTSLGAPRSDEEAALYLLVFRQIVSTVAVMAERGVMHFDLKCENILVRRSSASGPPPACPLASPAALNGALSTVHHVAPSVCVADFGESVIGRRCRRRRGRGRTAGADSGISSREHPTADSATGDDFFFDVRGARGTERIQSPEMVLLSRGGAQQARPSSGSGGAREEAEEVAGRITPASDVWSLGCLLYELLSNQPLFGDLQWSEFFVTLTAGGAVAGPTTGDDDAGMAQVVPALPPPRCLRPFASLGCAEALRQLLAVMLVRNPVNRPSASQTVRYVDEALAAIASSISKNRSQDSAGSDTLMMARGKPSPLYPRKVDGRTSASSRTPNTDANGNVCRRSAESGGNGADIAGTETLSQGAISSRVAERGQASKNGEKRLTASNLTSAAMLALLRPCMAVAAHRNLVAERSALLGCDGCLHRLGAGAFVVTVPAGGSNSNNKGHQFCPLSNKPDQKLSAWPRVGPETRVWCSAADRDNFIFGGEMKPGMEEAGESRYTLGSVLPVLGISHVVCVISRQAEVTGARRCSSATKQNASCEPQLPVSQIAEGSRLLRVFVPTEEDTTEGEEGRNGPVSRISGPHSMKGVVRDVLEFATGPRVLFVGGDDGGCGHVAGALALVWAMARTGKGSYETMLDFRQECVGFYVDAAMLKQASGYVEK